MIVTKYYQPTLHQNIESYVKSHNVYLVLKKLWYKQYKNLSFLSIFIYQQQKLSIYFVTNLPILKDQKKNNYNSILVIVNKLTKIVYQNPIKTTINLAKLAKIIIYMIIKYYNLWDSIISNKNLLFTSKFGSSLCYFLGIKQKLSTVFYL